MSRTQQSGQKIVEVTPEAIEGIFINEKRIRTNLPDDARFLRILPPTQDRGIYQLVFESSEWDVTDEAAIFPIEHTVIDDD